MPLLRSLALGALGLTGALGTIARADAPVKPSPFPFGFAPPGVKPKPQKADAEKLLTLLSIKRACETPLDLNAKNASLEQIVAGVRGRLPAPVPTIEVRGALPVRLSFTLKNSTVGDALGAAAALAGAKLWVLPDRLLLAPKTALLAGEGRDEWAWDAGWNSSTPVSPEEFQRVFASLIADELTANQKKVPGALLLPTVKTTFGALSPFAQKILRSLVDQMNAQNGSLNAFNMGNWSESTKPRMLVLSPNSEIDLNANGEGLGFREKPQDNLVVHGSSALMSWTTNGGMASSGFSFGFQDSGTPQPNTNLPPLDPSAGKS